MTGLIHDRKVVDIACLSVTPRGIIMDAVMHKVRTDCNAATYVSTDWDQLFEAAVEAVEQVALDENTPNHLAQQATFLLKDRGKDDNFVEWQEEFIALTQDVLAALIRANELVLLDGGAYVVGYRGHSLMSE